MDSLIHCLHNDLLRCSVLGTLSAKDRRWEQNIQEFTSTVGHSQVKNEKNKTVAC